jgi:hypothetical protein
MEAPGVSKLDFLTCYQTPEKKKKKKNCEAKRRRLVLLNKKPKLIAQA